MSIMDRLDGVISRHAELSALMASGDCLLYTSDAADE